MLRFFDRSRLIEENVGEPTMKVTVECRCLQSNRDVNSNGVVIARFFFGFLSFELKVES